jgi:hypothetical protein
VVGVRAEDADGQGSPDAAHQVDRDGAHLQNQIKDTSAVCYV